MEGEHRDEVEVTLYKWQALEKLLPTHAPFNLLLALQSPFGSQQCQCTVHSYSEFTMNYCSVKSTSCSRATYSVLLCT